MRILDSLKKPEYIFRPSQLVHRLVRRPPAGAAFATIQLPWGLPLTIRPDEMIGRRLWTLGVFELTVTEALWRWIDPGEVAVDVGANLGYMTSVMASRAGAGGRVFAFEPHPDVHKDLMRNVEGWRRLPGLAEIVPFQTAVGDSSGVATLSVVSEDFSGNRGLARITSEGESFGDSVEVPVERLDKLLASVPRIGVMKLDVEGHELNVCRGAGELLGNGIRDVVFEEHDAYPTPLTEFLEGRGYTIFALRKGVWGPGISAPAAPSSGAREWETQNFLATRDPARAQARLTGGRWRSLRGS